MELWTTHEIRQTNGIMYIEHYYQGVLQYIIRLDVNGHSSWLSPSGYHNGDIQMEPTR